ncbi:MULTISPECIES: DUF421 domain-containing protein [unclassified Paenibacillus]|uniref:DUF421 domain-containing protein n=1 Tax=unclassified Paenibacillus TaxID=185978 RepID=UPI000955AB3A|nr:MULTISPECIES: DUF421 domain-containing protein [unclassified Paenibacillus]ASS65579.1 DUF421 domain-containing protein [Paenibacillus sp. RUD330]SIQ31105.1 Uncharacterized membrane protein YcaP, DUF421 family [Paenibacillus sp. RU4X]SIQ52811.1 Uncharacterized membrane protein YcaP, DUF421 family [Paenibacillus sp. RU4T]
MDPLFGQIALKLLIALVSLMIMTKVLGKKEISQLTAFDFVSSLMLSELVGNTIYDKEVGYGHLVFALAVWTLLSYGTEKLLNRIPWLARRVTGSPDLVIREGIIDRAAMKRNNLDFGQLSMLLRENGVFSVRDVAYALFETNGSISVLSKPAAGGHQQEETPDSPSLPESVIEDGDIVDRALERLGRDRRWLLGLLAHIGIGDEREILYAEWSDASGLFYQLQSQRPPEPGARKLQSTDRSAEKAGEDLV